MQVRLLTIYSTYTGSTEIPQIRIQGKWLEKLGFIQGKKFIVEEKQGQLTLRVVSLESEK
jgi:toxic protein SymE